MIIRRLLFGCFLLNIIASLLGCVSTPAKHYGGFHITSGAGQEYYTRIINFVGIKGMGSTKRKEYLALAYLEDPKGMITRYRTGRITTEVTVYNSFSKFSIVQVPAENYEALIFRKGDIQDFNELGIKHIENGGSWGTGVLSFVSHTDNRNIILGTGDAFRVDRLPEDDYLNALHNTIAQ